MTESAIAVHLRYQPRCRLKSPAMAEADSTSVPATDAASGSSSNLVQLDVDTLKWELTDLKAKFELLTKRVDDLAGPKVEEVGCAHSWSTVPYRRLPHALDLLPFGVDLSWAALSRSLLP